MMLRQENLYTFFETSWKKHPHQIAISDCGEIISYQQLHQRVHEFLYLFKEMGMTHGQFVGVHLKPGSGLVAILLAITKLGAVFVPLECSYPKKRLLFMIEDAGLSFLITEKPDPDFESNVTCPQLFLETIETPDITSAIELDEVELTPQDTCYVIYTSGTTGDPKGVLVNYAGAMNTVVHSAHTMDVQSSHRLLQLCPISFDVFVLEVGMVVLAGAALVIVNDIEEQPLDEVLRRENIQHILCTPNFVAEVDLDNTPLHSVMFGGEPLPEALVKKYLEKFRIIHAYGITEASICSTLGLCDGNYPISMGSPLPNTSLELLDENQNPVKSGEAGEIVLAGRGISNGYLNRPHLNSQRFIDDPDNPGKKRFRTGDMARKDELGNLIFLGRNDRQIKYREHRLELFEVEALLLRRSEVSQAAVLLIGDQLWAFVCLKTSEFDTEALSQYLKQYLPEPLVPEIKQLDAMPLTSHNKINYVNLTETVN